MDANPEQIVPDEFDDSLLPDAGGLPDFAPADPEGTPSLAPLLDIPVRVQAILGGASLSVDELLRTRAGSVIELDRRVGEPVDVLVNDRLIARGELVLIDGSLGITLTEVVKAEG